MLCVFIFLVRTQGIIWYTFRFDLLDFFWLASLDLQT